MELGIKKINKYEIIKIYLGLGVVEIYTLGHEINGKMSMLNEYLDYLEYDKLITYIWDSKKNEHISQCEKDW